MTRMVWIMIFLLIALMAGIHNRSHVETLSLQLAGTLFGVLEILFLVSLVSGGRYRQLSDRGGKPGPEVTRPGAPPSIDPLPGLPTLRQKGSGP